jgi:hypothetical protein
MLKTNLNKDLAKEFIWEFKLLIKYPVLFILKKKGL